MLAAPAPVKAPIKSAEAVRVSAVTKRFMIFLFLQNWMPSSGCEWSRQAFPPNEQ
jgi:hypothetical protein